LTRRFSNSNEFNMFGTFRRQTAAQAALGEWSNIVNVHDVVVLNAVNGAANTAAEAYDASNLGYETTLTPAAMTVQILNTNALQTTAGSIYAGVCHSQLGVSNSPETWRVWGERFIATQKPRALSAAQLAVRGAAVHSYPLNLESLCDFTEVTSTGTSSTFTWSDLVIQPSGLAPIVVINPEFVELEFVVTIELRVRFSMSHPASSTHVMHPVTPEATWHRALTAAATAGHGVLDVLELGAGLATRARAFAPAAAPVLLA